MTKLAGKIDKANKNSTCADKIVDLALAILSPSMRFNATNREEKGL